MSNRHWIVSSKHQKRRRPKSIDEEINNHIVFHRHQNIVQGLMIDKIGAIYTSTYLTCKLLEQSSS